MNLHKSGRGWMSSSIDTLGSRNYRWYDAISSRHDVMGNLVLKGANFNSARSCSRGWTAVCIVTACSKREALQQVATNWWRQLSPGKRSLRSRAPEDLRVWDVEGGLRPFHHNAREGGDNERAAALFLTGSMIIVLLCHFKGIFK